MGKLKCDICGKEKDKVVYWLGAKPDPDMDDPAEGWTKDKGKIMCSTCHERKATKVKLAKALHKRGR